ncbi:MAG TPA: bifunctional hydroxymethylpyrimidine kinase/phosphomethylpyrimidine kinase [Gemmatimonadaceae bacterium]|jgi:hydroxymethylpyrimidine/phosphomethylpyrimidine kinase|nr:bifunctional hydroxymethylpyrimidine kinase/phosphomethylpyrimidine kinase [Gemmatimonadaceae bacterium]
MQSLVLTIAGSDSSAGAGIQADLATFARFGVRGATAITAITAQNDGGVIAWSAVDPVLVRAQIDAIDHVDAVKSGMLANPAIVATVAEAIAERRLRPYVLDPVTVAGTGHALAHGDLTPLILKCLVPLADLVTPNLGEAAALLGSPVRDAEAMARELVARGARAVLVKGGHLDGDDVVDVLCDENGVRQFRRTRVRVKTHGTGCRLSAGIAANLALGESLDTAVERAGDFVHELISGLRSGE